MMVMGKKECHQETMKIIAKENRVKLNTVGCVVGRGEFGRKLCDNVYGDKLCSVRHKKLSRNRDDFWCCIIE